MTDHDTIHVTARAAMQGILASHVNLVRQPEDTARQAYAVARAMEAEAARENAARDKAADGDKIRPPKDYTLEEWARLPDPVRESSRSVCQHAWPTNYGKVHCLHCGVLRRWLTSIP